jgi:hypothetical protein
MPYTEIDPLLPPSRREASKQSVSKEKIFALVVACLASVLIMGLAARASSDKNVPGTQMLAVSEQGLSFAVNNAYGEAKYGSEHPFVGDKYVVEPHKMMTFLPVLGSNDASRINSYHWEIDGVDGAEGTTVAFGKEVEVTFSEPGEMFNVKVVAHDEEGEEVDRFESQVVSAYVKRELRKMNEHDKEAFLDAAAVLWRTSTTEGRALYGAQYTGMDTFVQGASC